MKKQLILLLSILLLVLGALPALAEGGDSAVTAKLTPAQTELTLGDPVDLTLEVTHPAGYQVIAPKLPKEWGAFEVISQSPTQTTPNDDGSETTRQTITVTLFDLGSFETPPLGVTVSSPDGQTQQVEALPLALIVTPTRPEGDTDLRDIKPQADVSVPFPWAAVLGSLAALLILAALGYFVYRRWLKPKQLAAAVDNRPPYQRALDDLARIAAMQLPQQGRFKEHYTLVTDVLRRYLEARYGVNALERTTAELHQELKFASISPELTRRFIALFEDSDFVKFAKVIPELQESEELIAKSEALIMKSEDELRPRELPTTNDKGQMTKDQPYELPI